MLFKKIYNAVDSEDRRWVNLTFAVINVNLSDFESRHVSKTYCPYFDRPIMLKEYILPYIHSLGDYDLV